MCDVKCLLEGGLFRWASDFVICRNMWTAFLAMTVVLDNSEMDDIESEIKLMVSGHVIIIAQ